MRHAACGMRHAACGMHPCEHAACTHASMQSRAPCTTMTRERVHAGLQERVQGGCKRGCRGVAREGAGGRCYYQTRPNAACRLLLDLPAELLQRCVPLLWRDGDQNGHYRGLVCRQLHDLPCEFERVQEALDAAHVPLIVLAKAARAPHGGQLAPDGADALCGQLLTAYIAESNCPHRASAPSGANWLP